MKKLLVIASLALSGAAVMAAPLSPEAALGRALRDAPQQLRGSSRNFKLAATRSEAGRECVYLYSSPAGFLAVSADDAVPALVGYGSNQLADADGRMAPELEFWISQLARQVDYAASREQSGRKAIPMKARPQREPIAPMLTTLWSQGNPYNKYCPKSGDQLCVTGCVATAMAQAMKYHNWPETGEGSHSYSVLGKTLTMNYSKVSFKWDKMLDQYGDDDPRENQNAVAQLMYAAGISVDMNYSPDGSGAQSMKIGGALGRFFRYDKSMRYLLRDNYNLYDWEDIIYNSLKNYGPVIYGGQSYAGGHSFVCDGYDKDGYFHFNWGWAGLSDGYFMLDLLDPMSQGTGGSADNSGFDFMQDILVDIRPDRDGSSEWSEAMVMNQGLSLSVEEEDGLKYLLQNGLVYNPGPYDLPETVGIGFTLQRMDQTDELPTDYIVEMGGECQVGYGMSSFGVDCLTDLPDGKYLVWMSFRDSKGNVSRVPGPVYSSTECQLEVSGDTYTLTPVEPVLPEVDFINYPAEINLADEGFKITGRLKSVSTTDYYSQMTPLILDESGDLAAMGQQIAFDIEADGTYDIDYHSPLMVPRGTNSPEPGNYYIVMCVTNGAYYLSLGEEAPVAIVDNGSGLIDIEAASDAPAVYYTPQGIHVGSNPDILPAGIYIERRGNTSRKVAVTR